jgi:hypothetical protein
MRAALADDHFPDRRTASPAGTFFLIERAQTVGKAAAHAIDTLVHYVNARPADGNRARQNLTNRVIEASAFGARQRFDLAKRVQARVPKRFICVNVSDASEKSLVEEKGFQVAAAFPDA